MSNRLGQTAYNHLPALALDDVEAWVDKHLVWVQRKKSLNTYIAYASTLTKFVAWCREWDRPLGPACLDEFCERPRPPRAPDGASQATYNRDLAALRLFFSWLNDYEELGVRNPCGALEAKRIERGTPKAIPFEVWCRVWYSDLTDDERLWLGLAYYAGFRKSELDQTLTGEFDVVARQIVDFTRKGDRKKVVEYGAFADVVIKRVPAVSGHVQQWLDIVEATVRSRDASLPINARAGHYDLETGEITFDVNHAWVHLDLRKVLRRVGLSENAFAPHDMRRSFCTNLTDAGVPPHLIQAAMGHASGTTTQRYQRTDGAMQRFADGL
jgi:site-specific recombinase XerD